MIVPTPARVPSQNSVQGDAGALSRVVSRADGAVTGTLTGNGRFRMTAASATTTPLVIPNGADFDANLADLVMPNGDPGVMKARMKVVCEDGSLWWQGFMATQKIPYP